METSEALQEVAVDFEESNDSDTITLTINLPFNVTTEASELPRVDVDIDVPR